MSASRSASLIVFLALVVVWSAPGDAATAPQATEPPPGGPAPGPTAEVAADASRVMLPCIPVGTYSTAEPSSRRLPEAPALAVVSTDVRPKNARVHLDGAFIGRAKFFNGTKGFLYLEPGSYRLELRHDGYRTVVIELDAAPRCRYELKHFLERDPGAVKHDDVFGRGEPAKRVFGPTGQVMASAAAAGSESRPDPTLRPDLGRGQPSLPSQRPDASLRLTISPPEARLSIDGVFVATGRELAGMEGPLAVASGSRRLEVTAPGRAPWTRTVELERGQTIELEIVLESPDAT